MSIHLEIGGVNYSDVIAALDLEPSGPGKVGTGTLHLLEPGSSITDRQTVKLWQVDSGGHLIRRYFGGYVGGAGTGRLGGSTHKTWALPLQDYNLANKRIVAPVQAGLTLAAGTFAAQIADAVATWQAFGGTPSVVIDASSKVVNLTGATVLPAITGLSGKSLGYVLQQICNAAQADTPALRPRWYFGLDDSFGGTTPFGVPVLWVYNAADVTSTVAHYGDLLNNIRVGTYQRTTTSPALVDWRQGVYGDPAAVVTSFDTTAHATYFCDLTGHGYWADEPLEDKDSATSAAAQATLDRNVAATAYPRETVEFDSTTFARPGDTVLLTWAADGLSAVGYRVVGVRLNFLIPTPDAPVCTLTLGSIPREVGVADGDTIGNPPVVGDHVPPDAPTALAGTSTYSGASHTTSVSGTFIAPPQADYNYTELRYRERLNAGAWGNWAVVTGLHGDPGATQSYTIPNLHVSTPGQTWETYVVAQAYDFNHNGSGFSTPITVTNASVDAPGPPTSLTYTSHYNGNGGSDAVVSFTAGVGGGTRAYYIFYLTINGLTRPTGPIPAAATSVSWKDLVPGKTYTVTGQAFTQYGDAGAVSSPALSVIAATAVNAGWERDPIPDGTDGDTGAFSRDFTASATGSGTAPTLDTTTVWEGQAAWKLPVGSTAGTTTVTANYRKAAQPGQRLTYRFREGNAGAAQGTLALYIQPYDKSGAAVGSAVAAYSGAPSTAAAGAVREGQYPLPSTSTITSYGWFLKYTGNGANARTVYASGVQVVPSAGVIDTHYKPTSTGPLQLFDAADVDRGWFYLSDATPGTTPAVLNITGHRDPGDATISGDTRVRLADTFGNTITQEETGISYNSLLTHLFSGWLALTATSVSVSGTLNTGNGVVYFTGGAGQTLTLPTLTANLIGGLVWLRNTSANAVTIARGGTDTIEGATSYSLAAGNAVLLAAQSGQWRILSDRNASTVTAVTATSPLASSGGTTPNLSLSNQSANQILAGPSTGLPAAPTFRALVNADLATTTAILNPMTTPGDLIKGGAAGDPGRLGIGTAGQSLMVVGGGPAWSAPEIELAFKPYRAYNPAVQVSAAGTSELWLWTARTDHLVTLVRWVVLPFVNGTSNALNRWDITLVRFTTTGSVCATVDSRTCPNGNWLSAPLEVTSFANQPAAGDIGLQVRATKVGTPGNLELWFQLYAKVNY